MTKKQNTIYGIMGLVLGVFGGIAGTAFSMGADRQRVNDLLNQHTLQVASLVAVDKEQKEEGQQERNRLTKILADQISHLQSSITDLASVVGDVRTDVQVIKALMERMENDLKNRNLN